MRISIRDPLPGVGVFGGSPSTANKPAGGGFVTSVIYYSTVFGPIGFVDPGNVFEVRALASRWGWGLASAWTLGRGVGLPIVYGVLADPHHVRTGGLDDSNLGIADDRRRHGGSPYSHSSHFGSAQAWSPWNRSV